MLWKVDIWDGSVIGLHLCKEEKAWMKRTDGWAMVTFMFEDAFGTGHMCSSCKERIPKETIAFYTLCKRLFI